MPTTTGLATSFITFSRPGASGGGATVTDRDGKIKWAGHNLLLASESFDSSSWSRSGMTGVTANSTAALNSTTTADTAVESNTLADHWLSQTASMPAGSTVTLSVYVKRGSGTRNLYLRCLAQGGSDLIAAYYNLGTGAVGSTVNGGTGVISSTTITDAGSGWYLCTLTGVFSTSNALSSVAVGIANATTVGSHYFTGDGTSSLILWGAHLYRSDMQMQANPAMPAGMQSYYPTTPRNLLGATEAFSDASVWGYTGLSAFGSGSVANAIVAPNGLQTADLITAAASTNSHSIQQQKTTVANTEVTYSVYAKYSTAQYIAFGFLSGAVGSAWAFATVDIQSGTITQTTVGAGASTTATAAITSVGNGWHRISIKVKSNTSDTYAIAHIVNSATPSFGSFGSYSWTAAGTESVYLWGAQLSDSASLDAYSPQYGAAVTSAAYYAPRLDFDPVTLAAKGLLVEEARTNLALNSNAVGGSSYTLRNTTITANAGVAPDGTSTATKLQETTGSNFFDAYQSMVVTSGASYTSSVYAKAVERNWIWMQTANGNNKTWFNLSTGVVGTNGAGNTATITAVGNGWYRCTVSCAAATTAGYIDVGLSNADNTLTYTGVAGSGVLLWGAQLEAGSFATSYIPTGASTATRAADVASVSTQAFPYGASEGTVVVNATGVGAGAYPFTLNGAGNTGNDALYCYVSGGNYLVQAFNGGNLQANINTGVAEGVAAKVGAAYADNNFGVSANGGAVTPDATYSQPGVDKLRLGSSANGTVFGRLHIRQITYLPRRISNAELVSRTSN